jgi:hypothetical protein
MMISTCVQKNCSKCYVLWVVQKCQIYRFEVVDSANFENLLICLCRLVYKLFCIDILQD